MHTVQENYQTYSMLVIIYKIVAKMLHRQNLE